MAVRDDFAAGEVLAAADLNDTFASKPTFTYGTATPTADAEGAIWYDENSTPPVPKFWDGSAWQVFSAGAADFSDSATGTYTDTGVSYKYITFTASGTLTVTKAGFADVLIVGGGGGGGNLGGGGGGGGHLAITDAYLPAGSLTVTVGAGGAGVTVSSGRTRPGNNGVTSRLGSYFSPGGGAGAGIAWQQASSNGASIRGFNGGSGGGASGHISTSAEVGGSGISGLGSDGGSGASNGGGGGGGASAVGANASTSVGGNGGNGEPSSITGSSVTRAGGGGGYGSTSGSGGTGGGGAAGTNGTAGTANTGGGGGASGGSNGNVSAAGGSGVVIVRVKV